MILTNKKISQPCHYAYQTKAKNTRNTVATKFMGYLLFPHPAKPSKYIRSTPAKKIARSLSGVKLSYVRLLRHTCVTAGINKGNRG